MTDDKNTTPTMAGSTEPPTQAPGCTDLPVKVRMEGDQLSIEVRQSPEAACEAFGTTSTDFLEGFVGSLAVAFQNSRRIGTQRQLDTALAYVQSMEPRDEVEALLLGQMAAINAAMLRSYANFDAATIVEQYDSASNALNKLSRTFVAQVEALKRYRTGGEQRVTVQHQHVNVEDGGQAVVGAVVTGGRGCREKSGSTS